MLKVERWQEINIYWSVWHYSVPGSILIKAHMWPHSAKAFTMFSPPFISLQSQGRRSVCLLTCSHGCTEPEGKPQIMPRVIARKVGFKGWDRSEMKSRNREGTCDSLDEHYRKWPLWRVPRCLCVYNRLWSEQVKICEGPRTQETSPLNFSRLNQA